MYISFYYMSNIFYIFLIIYLDTDQVWKNVKGNYVGTISFGILPMPISLRF
jgi:hypothetical protein